MNRHKDILRPGAVKDLQNFLEDLLEEELNHKTLFWAKTMEKNINYYLNLPYTIELQQDPEEGWFVRVKELPGCMSQGDTPEEAFEMIRDAMQGWLEIALEDDLPIPEPRPEEDYSGKFVVRVPKSLHRKLVEEAEREGVSLNQYINVTLARSVAGL